MSEQESYMYSEADMPIRTDLREPLTPSGIVLHLCVAHELDRRGFEHVQAITTINGYSVCREHLDAIVAHMRGGTRHTTLLELMIKGELTV